MNKTGTIVDIMRCPICEVDTDNLSEHLRQTHEEKEIELAIIADKNRGLSDVEIGKKYGITYRQMEKVIRKATVLVGI